mgnify:FL=1
MKYHNKKTEYNGMTFDSRKELNRYIELTQLEKRGKISDLQRQVKFVLIPSQRIDGKVWERECAYKADFTYRTDGGQVVVEDTKGMRTREYIIKRKLMLYIYGVKIIET